MQKNRGGPSSSVWISLQPGWEIYRSSFFLFMGSGGRKCSVRLLLRQRRITRRGKVAIWRQHHQKNELELAVCKSWHGETTSPNANSHQRHAQTPPIFPGPRPGHAGPTRRLQSIGVLLLVAMRSRDFFARPTVGCFFPRVNVCDSSGHLSSSLKAPVADVALTHFF